MTWMTKLGAHLSISGGYTKALEKLVMIGGNCLQMFSSSPRGWSTPTISSQTAEDFRSLKTKLKINPVYFHATYLINLAGNNQVADSSKKALIWEMQLAAQLGIKGTIVHLGSFKDENADIGTSSETLSQSYNNLIKNILEVLEKTPPNTLFIIENAGTKKIGLTLDEIAKIIGDVNDKRVRVCFDTCHLHAAGYNLSTKEHLDEFLNIFNSFIGLEKIELWHLNDSKDPFGSRRDRHENIGSGQIGSDVFKLLLNHPLTKNLSFIIETPGFDEKGPDKQNLDILKGLIIKEESIAAAPPVAIAS